MVVERRTAMKVQSYLLPSLRHRSRELPPFDKFRDLFLRYSKIYVENRPSPMQILSRNNKLGLDAQCWGLNIWFKRKLCAHIHVQFFFLKSYPVDREWCSEQHKCGKSLQRNVNTHKQLTFHEDCGSCIVSCCRNRQSRSSVCNAVYRHHFFSVIRFPYKHKVLCQYYSSHIKFGMLFHFECQCTNVGLCYLQALLWSQIYYGVGKKGKIPFSVPLRSVATVHHL